jgi:hypothetical protein
MPESLEQSMARIEQMKHETGLDEKLQHICWSLYEEYVTLEQIRGRPDPVITFFLANLNDIYEAIPSISELREARNDRRKA